MADTGFEYAPIAADALIGIDNPIDRNAHWEEQRGWVADHGYGIATKSYATLVDELDSPIEVADRNHALMAQMSAEEREIYYEALAACEGEAVEEHPPVIAAGDFDISDVDPEVIAEVQSVASAIQADVEWQQAWQRWESCMHNGGFDFAERSDAPESVQRMLDDALRLHHDDDSAARSAVAEVAEYEIDVAVADLECTIGSVIATQREIEQRYIDDAFSD